MSKKETEQQVREIVKQVISESQKKKLQAFHQAQLEMARAEKKLAESFDEKQRALYEEFCKTREAFYASAQEIYFSSFE